MDGFFFNSIRHSSLVRDGKSCLIFVIEDFGLLHSDVVMILLFLFSLYINLFPLNFRRLFYRQGQLTRNKKKKFINVINGMSGCNNLHFYRNFLLIPSGILTTLFFFL